MDYGLERRMNEYFTYPNDFRLVVGPERKEWTLNAEIMAERIKFFKAALNGDFREGINRVIVLPEDDGALFGRLIDWAYGHNLREDEYYKRDANTQHYLNLAKTYVLADKYMMADLQFILYAQYSQCAKANHYLMSKTEIDYVYGNTMEGSGLRSLLTTQYVTEFISGTCDLRVWSERTSHHAQFHLDVILGLNFHLQMNSASRTRSRHPSSLISLRI